MGGAWSLKTHVNNFIALLCELCVYWQGRNNTLARKVIVYYIGGKTIFDVGGQQEKNIKDVYMIEY